MILNDVQIITRCINDKMIEPFCDTQIKKKIVDVDPLEKLPSPNIVTTEEKCISYGVSSYGYDIRIADEFKIFTNINNTIIDPKNFNEDVYIDHQGEFCIIPPNSFILCRSLEYLRIPKDILSICIGKSTYARCGLIVNVTPLEPDWEGHITIEISNTTTLPAKIYANEGIAQLIFLKGEECQTSYKDRNGKYQNQTGVTLPKP